MNGNGRKKSILMVCSQVPPVYGGAGAQASLLAKELAARGWTVRIVSLDQMNSGSGKEGSVHFHRVMAGVAAKSKWSRFSTTFALSAAAFVDVIRHRPSVVHVHGAYWWSIAPVIAARIVGATSIVKTTRDGEDDAATVVAKRVGPIPIGKIYSLSMRLATFVVVLSRSTLESTIRAGISNAIQMRNGVDVSALRRDDERRRLALDELALHGGKVVTFVGYLVKHKGVGDLLKAWKLVGDRDSELWLAGPSTGFYRELDDETPAQIRDLIDQGFRVREFGLVEKEELSRIYWASNAFVLPSYKEGMPNSLMEAAVAGCELIATRIPGVVDLLDDTNAWLVEPGDISALANAISAVISGATRDHETAARAMGIDAVATSYESLYLERRN